ncbi:MAG: HAD family hydrolase [Nocardioides sp.]
MPETSSPAASEPVDTVVLDVDGTLVDSVYRHTVAWAEAFRSVGVTVPAWRLHRAIGMGGDRLVTAVAGEQVETEHGDEVRRRHGELFSAGIDEVTALPGAAELVPELRRRGLTVVLASSGGREQTERLLALVGGEELTGSGRWLVTSDDVERSKPAPDLVSAAVERVGGDRVAMVGDAVWDVEAAREHAALRIGLLCGGFGEAELRDAGADAVFESPQDLLDNLDATPLSGR